MDIIVTINGKTFPAEIHDTAAGRAFMDMLPLSFEMEELNVLVCLNEHYTFNGANFRHMMGDYETVFNELDSFGGEGE